MALVAIKCIPVKIYIGFVSMFSCCFLYASNEEYVECVMQTLAVRVLYDVAV
jgi:hypothetical protein